MAQTKETKKSKTGVDDPDLGELAQLVISLRKEVKDLRDEQKKSATEPARFARGTGSTKDETPKLRGQDLVSRIREFLSGRPKSMDEIAKELGLPIETVMRKVAELEVGGQVGTMKLTMAAVEAARKAGRGGDLRRYFWRSGAEGPKAERRAVVVGLLMEEPMGNEELIKHTGALAKDIENDLVEIRRHEPVWHMNKGAGGVGRGNIYWIDPDRREPPPELDGRLAKKTR